MSCRQDFSLGYFFYIQYISNFPHRNIIIEINDMLKPMTCTNNVLDSLCPTSFRCLIIILLWFNPDPFRMPKTLSQRQLQHKIKWSTTFVAHSTHPHEYKHENTNVGSLIPPDNASTKNKHKSVIHHSTQTDVDQNMREHYCQ